MLHAKLFMCIVWLCFVGFLTYFEKNTFNVTVNKVLTITFFSQ